MASIQRDVFKRKTVQVKTQFLDVDGKPVKIEVRDDEEQQIKYQEIINTLVSAGYFRARIIGLSPFDMVVGGLTWCIDTSEIDIDVDLLFEEGLTIGQKIALTEKIVAVLPKIKCPYFIEPHQIQGLDFIHILPVIQWLVKWSTENRQRKAEYLRSYAINQFHKRYPFPDDTILQTRKKLFSNVENVLEKYNGYPFCTVQDLFDKFPGELEQVEATLYEYGLSSTQRYLESDSHMSNSLLKVLKNNASPVISDKFKCRTSGGLNTTDESNINEMAKKYSTLHIQEKTSKKRIADEIEILNEKKKHIENTIAEIVKETELLDSKVQNSELNMENFTPAETSALKEIQVLLIEHEELEKYESKFKEDCKEEMSRLQDEILELEESENNTNEIEELENHLKEHENKLQLLKYDLGKLTREVLLIEKDIDQIPSKAELAQYQKRFVELYDQIAAKHKETKQYYNLFNTLTDKCQYLRKVHNVVNSIYDNYDEALASSSRAKEEFKSQLHTIKGGVEQTAYKVMQKRNNLRKTKEKLISQIEFLQERKRRYISTVKEFSALCRENEQLLDEIRRFSNHTDVTAVTEQKIIYNE